MVAELIEALHHACGRESPLYDHARAARSGGEFLIDAIHRLPVVRRVDEDLACEPVGRELSKAVGGHGQDDDVRVADDLVGRNGAGPGGKHLDGQRDVIGRPRP